MAERSSIPDGLRVVLGVVLMLSGSAAIIYAGLSDGPGWLVAYGLAADPVALGLLAAPLIFDRRRLPAPPRRKVARRRRA